VIHFPLWLGQWVNGFPALPVRSSMIIGANIKACLLPNIFPADDFQVCIQAQQHIKI